MEKRYVLLVDNMDTGKITGHVRHKKSGKLVTFDDTLSASIFAIWVRGSYLVSSNENVRVVSSILKETNRLNKLGIPTLLKWISDK